MKKLIRFALVLCVVACKKDSMPDGSRILRVTVDGKTHQSFEYDDGNRLVKEKEYFSCTITPMNEFVYTYKDNRLEKINSVLRNFYSSTAAMCDPASGLHTEEVFSYDGSGRISKVVRPASTTDHIYNQQGFLSKKLFGSGSNNSFEYVYDSKGNVIKETDPQGRVTEYEYDSAPNPFYQHRPNIATPFTLSPNNIIKGKGAANFVRKFEYKSNMPVRVLEDNGLTYEYHYK